MNGDEAIMITSLTKGTHTTELVVPAIMPAGTWSLLIDSTSTSSQVRALLSD